MADKKISALTAVGAAPTTTDVLPIVNGGSTKKITTQNLLDGVTSLTALAEKPATDDTVLLFDTSVTTAKKMTVDNLHLGYAKEISVSGSPQTLGNSNTETTLYTFTLPAGTLLTDDRWLRIVIPSFLHATDQAVTVRWRVKIAGITVSDYTTGSLSSGTRPGRYTCELRRNGGANATIACADSTFNTASGGTDRDATTDGTNTINLANDMTVTVTAQHSVQASAVTITTDGYKVICDRSS